MSMSFAISVADDVSYLRRCLEGVVACARPGDQVVVVDAGSHDGSDRVARAVLAAPERDPAVEWTSIELGNGARGRPGIADRIALDAAARDWVLPLRSADRLRPAACARALRAARESGADLVIANYLVGDEEAPTRPPDASLWTLPAGALPDRIRALHHDWRPRRKLLRRQGSAMTVLGDAPQDDVAAAPFHWRACVAAARIAFVDAAIVHHAERPVDDDDVLGACFDAYDAIRRGLPPGDGALERAALGWLLSCVARDMARIAPGAAPTYATRGAACLGAVPAEAWDEGSAEGGLEVQALAGLLRRGDVAAAVAGLQGAALAREIAALREALAEMAGDASAGRRAAESVAAAMRFEALRALAPEAG